MSQNAKVKFIDKKLADTPAYAKSPLLSQTVQITYALILFQLAVLNDSFSIDIAVNNDANPKRKIMCRIFMCSSDLEFQSLN